MITAAQLDEGSFAGGLRALPPLPRVVLDLQAAVRGGKAGPNEIAKLIETDPALSAHVLRLANSSFYALPRQVTKISFAVAFLGLREMARISLALGVIRSLAPKDAAVLRRYWRHSFHTALTAKRLLDEFEWAIDPDEIHVAALLHDIGELAYARFQPVEHAAIRAYAAEERCFVEEAEAALGFPSHAVMGAKLSELWKLPRSIEQACLHHDLPHLITLDNKRSADPIAVTVTAANLASVLVEDPLTEPRQLAIRAELMRIFGLDEQRFLLFMADIVELENVAERHIDALL